VNMSLNFIFSPPYSILESPYPVSNTDSIVDEDKYYVKPDPGLATQRAFAAFKGMSCLILRPPTRLVVANIVVR
jgi:hypothetical protein